MPPLVPLRDSESSLRLKTLLDHVLHALTIHKIPYFLDMGTLLGFIREGHLLPWDGDADLSVSMRYYNRYKNVVIPYLRAKHNFFATVPYKYISCIRWAPRQKGEVQVMFRCEFHNHLVMLRHQEKAYPFVHGIVHLRKEWVEPRRKIVVMGKEYWVPRFPGLVLVHYYGEDCFAVRKRKIRKTNEVHTTVIEDESWRVSIEKKYAIAASTPKKKKPVSNNQKDKKAKAKSQNPKKQKKKKKSKNHTK